MEVDAVLIGASPSLAAAMDALSGLQLTVVEGDADDAATFDTDAAFVIVAYPSGQQEEVIVRELAADRHVLAVDLLAASAEEAQRCVTIALNRGLRLAVLILTKPVEPQIEQFAAWIDGGSEPEHSGRRWIAESVEAIS